MFVELKPVGSQTLQGYDVNRIAIIQSPAPNETRLIYEMDNQLHHINVAEPVGVVVGKVNAVRERQARASRPSTPHVRRQRTLAGRSPG